MHYLVLLVDGDRASLQRSKEQLTEHGINIITADNFKDATLKLIENGKIHVVLSEWELPCSKEDSTFTSCTAIFKRFWSFAMR